MGNRAVPPPWAVLDTASPLAQGLKVAFRPINQVERTQCPGMPVLTAAPGKTDLMYDHVTPSLMVAGEGLRTENQGSDVFRASAFFYAWPAVPEEAAFPPLMTHGGTLETYVRHTTFNFRLQSAFSGSTRTMEHPSMATPESAITLGFSWDRSSLSNVARMMNNGVIRAANVVVAGSGNAVSSSGSPWIIASDEAGGNSWLGRIYVALCWERLLSDGELMALHIDPYAVWWWEGKGPRYFT